MEEGPVVADAVLLVPAAAAAPVGEVDISLDLSHVKLDLTRADFRKPKIRFLIYRVTLVVEYLG